MYAMIKFCISNFFFFFGSMNSSYTDAAEHFYAMKFRSKIQLKHFHFDFFFEEIINKWTCLEFFSGKISQTVCYKLIYEYAISFSLWYFSYSSSFRKCVWIFSCRHFGRILIIRCLSFCIPPKMATFKTHVHLSHQIPISCLGMKM